MSIRIRTLANGKRVYDVQVTVEARDASGRRRKVTRTVKTKAEAIALDATLKVEATAGAVPDSRRTVGDLMDAWLEGGIWSPTTAYGYRRVVERDVRPALGTIRLSRLGPRHLDKLYKDLRDKGQAGNTVRNVHRALTAALNQAVKWGWLAHNPAARSTPGPVGGGEGRVATETEVRALLAAADPDLSLAIRLACATAMRRAELAALEWSDVDFTAGTVTVSRSRVDAGGVTVTKGTKTHAIRVVPLRAATLDLLRERRGIGSVLNASPITLSRRLAALCVEVGIEGPDFGWHAFRHYALTELAGVTDLKTVADIAGHSTTRVTERYVHVREDRKRAAIEALDARHGLSGI